MADLQVFDMNPPLNFPINEKSINPLQILDLLSTQNPSGSDDRKRQFFTDLMAPHYEKQVEIEKKVDDLRETLNQFIRSQQDMNKLIIEKYLGQNFHHVQECSSSPILLSETRIDSEKNEKESQNEEKIIESTSTTINNPMPVYPVPISQNSPIRNRSISPEKMETGEMSVRDYLKNTMTVQKADEKILEEELERERHEAAQAVRYNKFRVRNRPKKYKRSAVTFSSSKGSKEIPSVENSVEQHDQGQNQEQEENVFQPILVPCVQRAAPELDLSLMPPVFPTTSSYVLNTTTLDPSTHTTQNSLSALTDPKLHSDSNNIWKAVDGMTQFLVDAPSLLESDLRSFTDHHTHHSSFLPFVGNHEPLHRSAFVPAQYHKDRRMHQQMDPNISETLRNL